MARHEKEGAKSTQYDSDGNGTMKDLSDEQVAAQQAAYQSVHGEEAARMWRRGFDATRAAARGASSTPDPNANTGNKPADDPDTSVDDTNAKPDDDEVSDADMDDDVGADAGATSPADPPKEPASPERAAAYKRFVEFEIPDGDGTATYTTAITKKAAGKTKKDAPHKWVKDLDAMRARYAATIEKLNKENGTNLKPITDDEIGRLINASEIDITKALCPEKASSKFASGHHLGSAAPKNSLYPICHPQSQRLQALTLTLLTLMWMTLLTLTLKRPRLRM